MLTALAVNGTGVVYSTLMIVKKKLGLEKFEVYFCEVGVKKISGHVKLK